MLRLFIKLFIFSSFLLSCRPSPSVPIQLKLQELRSQLNGQVVECRVLEDIQRELQWIDLNKNRNNFFYCLGFLHGKDRSWQMQLLKETALGRRSERTSFHDLKRDFFFRILDLQTESNRLYQESSENFKKVLQIYALGVNSGFLNAIENYATKREWKFYGAHTLEAWKPEDAILILLLQSLDQTRKTFEQDFKEEAWIQALGIDFIKEAFEVELPWDAPILPSVSPHKSSSTSHEVEEKIFSNKSANESAHKFAYKSNSKFKYRSNDYKKNHTRFNSDYPETGSNSWVLAPKKTKAGYALLANDPHLSLQRPPIWYLTGVSQDNRPVLFGVTVPGIPVVASGANENVAWGITNAYAKFGRFFEVEVETFKGKWIRPVVWFRWLGLQIPVFWKKFPKSEAGWPVILHEDQNGTTRARVLIWSGLTLVAAQIEKMFELPWTNSAEQLDQVIRDSDVPGWNLLYSDHKQSMGYRMMGKLPKWSPGYGVTKLENIPRFFQDVKALPIVPIENRPSVFYSGTSISKFSNTNLNNKYNFDIKNSHGLLITANQRQFSRDGNSTRNSPRNSKKDKDLPPFLGSAHVESFRAKRIHDLLDSQNDWTLEKLFSVQCDQQAADAPYLFPIIKSLYVDVWPVGSKQALKLDQIENWVNAGAQVKLDCEECVFYEVLRESLLHSLDISPRHLFLLVSQNKSLPVPNLQRLELLNDVWKEAEKYSKKNGKSRKWKEVHQASFLNLFGHSFYPSGRISTGGGEHSVNPGTWKFSDSGLEHTSGASWRFLAEMGPKTRILFQTSGPNRAIALDTQSIEKGDIWTRWKNCEGYRGVNFGEDLSSLKKGVISHERIK